MSPFTSSSSPAISMEPATIASRVPISNSHSIIETFCLSFNINAIWLCVCVCVRAFFCLFFWPIHMFFLSLTIYLQHDHQA